MKLIVHGTGSGGNMYTVEADDEAILIDCGLSKKKTIREIAPRFKKYQGCLLSHEHNDHMMSAQTLTEMGITVYSSAGTAEALRTDGCLTRLNAVQMLSWFNVGQFTVLAFETQHDASQPCGFLIRYEPTGETLLYATDTYYLRNTFPGIHYWVVECNYIDEVLDSQQSDGELTEALRNRLKKSHMSLRRLLDVLKANDLTKTRAIVLIHLSDERSDERAMVKAVKEVTGIEEVTAATAGTTIQLTLNPF